MVFMFRDTAEAQGRDLFSCSDAEWQFLQTLATTFGWQPSGTTYQAPPRLKLTITALRNYVPGDASDRKDVSRDDAIDWGRALECAKRSPHFTAMLGTSAAAAAAHEPVSTASLVGLIDEFIAYVYGGAFSFASAYD